MRNRIVKVTEVVVRSAFYIISNYVFVSMGLSFHTQWISKDWRTDRMLRKLEALLAVADETASLIITGNGDVVQPENDLIAIGSGGPYAQAAARALLENTELSAREIAEKALDIAGDICIYTNHFHTIEELSYKA